MIIGINDEYSQRPSKIPGIGSLSATALVASIAGANCFRNGTQLSAWLGLLCFDDTQAQEDPCYWVSVNETERISGQYCYMAHVRQRV